MLMQVMDMPAFAGVSKIVAYHKIRIPAVGSTNEDTIMRIVNEVSRECPAIRTLYSIPDSGSLQIGQYANPQNLDVQTDILLKGMKRQAPECEDLLGEIANSGHEITITYFKDDCQYQSLADGNEPYYLLDTAVSNCNWAEVIRLVRNVAQLIGEDTLRSTLTSGMRPVMMNKVQWWSPTPFQNIPEKFYRDIPESISTDPGNKTIDTSKDSHMLARIILYYVSNPNAQLSPEHKFIFDKFQQSDPMSSIWHRILILHEDVLDRGPGGNAQIRFPFDSTSFFSNDEPRWLVLAHELVHCYHILTGQFYRFKVLEEARTTGLPPWDLRHNKYTENTFRKRAGLNERKYYRDHNKITGQKKFAPFYH